MPDLLSEASRRTGELLAGRYRLIERVGAGGMARVYRARDEVLSRDVAVKLFPTDGAEHSEETLRRAAEARVLASLKHPSLVTLYDAHVEAGETAFLVMEFIEGPTLRENMDAGDLDADQISAVLGDLAAALAAVHAGGVVHRDVKPSNVLLRPAQNGIQTQTVLADFGVAHLIDAARLTSPGTVIGTAAYLAPEQVRGEPPLPASDVYALGLVVLEALAGRHPFGNHSVQATILARLARQPDMPPGLADDWGALLTAMTAHAPADRPTAAEVAARAAVLGSPGDLAQLRTEVAAAPAEPTPTQPMPAAVAVRAPVTTAALPVDTVAAVAATRWPPRRVALSAGALVVLLGAALIAALVLTAPGPGRIMPLQPGSKATTAVPTPGDDATTPADEDEPEETSPDEGADRGNVPDEAGDNPNKGPGNNQGNDGQGGGGSGRGP